MTAKEKAKALYDSFYKIISKGRDVGDGFEELFGYNDLAKQCALIAIDFAINAIEDCSVVAGYPLEEYKQVREEILKQKP